MRETKNNESCCVFRDKELKSALLSVSVVFQVASSSGADCFESVKHEREGPLKIQ
jgi:hypothetical protein